MLPELHAAAARPSTAAPSTHLSVVFIWFPFDRFKEDARPAVQGYGRALICLNRYPVTTVPPTWLAITCGLTGKSVALLLSLFKSSTPVTSTANSRPVTHTLSVVDTKPWASD